MLCGTRNRQHTPQKKNNVPANGSAQELGMGGAKQELWMGGAKQERETQVTSYGSKQHNCDNALAVKTHLSKRSVDS